MCAIFKKITINVFLLRSIKWNSAHAHNENKYFVCSRMKIRITKPSNVIWLFLEAHSFVVLFNSPIHILIRASWTFLVFSVGALYFRIKRCILARNKLVTVSDNWGWKRPKNINPFINEAPALIPVVSILVIFILASYS